jgi:hypothetical protein
VSPFSFLFNLLVKQGTIAGNIFLLYMCNTCWLLFSAIYNIYHLDRLLVALLSMIIRFSFAEERLNRLMVFGKFPLMFFFRFFVLILFFAIIVNVIAVLCFDIIMQLFFTMHSRCIFAVFVCRTLCMYCSEYDVIL